MTTGTQQREGADFGSERSALESSEIGPVFAIDVLGCPAPKGSNRAMMRGGRAVFVPGGSRVNQRKLQSWDANVRQALACELGERSAPVFVGLALEVAIVFRLTRPSGHWGKHGLRPSAPLVPATKPDVDKLARSTLDSLIGSVFDDDSRIVRLVVDKQYASPGNEGATIRVQTWKPSLFDAIGGSHA